MFFNDLGRYFYICTGHRRNPWLALTELLGSAEPRLKNTILQDHLSGSRVWRRRRQGASVYRAWKRPTGQVCGLWFWRGDWKCGSGKIGSI